MEAIIDYWWFFLVAIAVYFTVFRKRKPKDFYGSEEPTICSVVGVPSFTTSRIYEDAEGKTYDLEFETVFENDATVQSKELRKRGYDTIITSINIPFSHFGHDELYLVYGRKVK